MLSYVSYEVLNSFYRYEEIFHFDKNAKSESAKSPNYISTNIYQILF